MRFTNVIAILAILGMAAQANAEGGTLRRTTTVAQNDETAAAQPQVVLVPVQSTTIQAAPAAQAQPTTVVEASPVTESKAEMLRKARQNQEVQTEQKIVEKLEESRLKEEQQRADRLFGDKLDTTAAPAAAAAVAPVPAPAPAPAPVPAPVEQKPQQVTIEKIEIVQPKEEKAAVAPAPAPVAESVTDVEDVKEEAPKQKFYVGAILAAPSYSAANLKTNYGLGFNVGTQIDSNFAIEGSFLYSNHYVDTFWDYNLYREMDQYDVQAAGKYYILTGKLKPYVGASLTYIYRTYQNRIKNSQAWTVNSSTQSEDTQALDAGLLAGVDFELNDKITIGAGFDWNTPVMNKSTPNFVSYGLPENTKPVENFDYTTVKVNAKMTF